jgi:gamma-glutamyl phosphate reductase
MRLFEYRRQQPWPPVIAVGKDWDTLYAAAVEDIDVLPDVDDAVSWLNTFIARIDQVAT